MYVTVWMTLRVACLVGPSSSPGTFDESNPSFLLSRQNPSMGRFAMLLP